MNNYLDINNKIYSIINSLVEYRYKYISVIDPITKESVMKIKLNLDDTDFITFLDAFFDKGLIIEKIDKSEFDSMDTNEIFKFNF